MFAALQLCDKIVPHNSHGRPGGPTLPIHAWQTSPPGHAEGAPMARLVHILAAVCAALVLTQCGAPHSQQAHHSRHVPLRSRKPAPELLSTARGAWTILADPARRNEWPAAERTYDSATAKLFDRLACGNNLADTAASLGTRLAPADRGSADPLQIPYLYPARSINPGMSAHKHTSPGIGVPVVGWTPETRSTPANRDFTPPRGMQSNHTAVLTFPPGKPPVWEFHEPLRIDQVRIGPTTHPLAADWTTALDYYWHMSRLKRYSIPNVLVPDRFLDDTGLFFAQPYDPAKIPVVFVHGLKSSAAAFGPMADHLLAEPWFRQHYQIWFFNYPTGLHWLYNAAVFRDDMQRAARYARAHGGARTLSHMVVVAHSMGGIITRASVSDPGHILYNNLFTTPFEKLPLNPEARAEASRMLFWKPLPEPKRIVYLAVPHRGSPMADRFFAIWISDAIHLPKRLTVDFVDLLRNDASPKFFHWSKANSLPTSINGLSPATPIIRSLQQMPIRPDIRYHSIIGDLGRGNSPHSSDGVVPYWSSHLDKADSERIIPAYHGLTAHPQTINEVTRILRLHLPPG